ncbi:hypothetical protein DM02DRAFT_617377 [Periconia macrospinosa]|uniref:Secreted protein n=1 Tax=Periconia macrospinosa TaxID=97972 RepID=A0A2V1DDL8_9PLEO|nr:hypothetical protein DM02DRAFT_617377 [Periconia macrospinosa]
MAFPIAILVAVSILDCPFCILLVTGQRGIASPHLDTGEMIAQLLLRAGLGSTHRQAITDVVYMPIYVFCCFNICKSGLDVCPRPTTQCEQWRRGPHTYVSTSLQHDRGGFLEKNIADEQSTVARAL